MRRRNPHTKIKVLSGLLSKREGFTIYLRMAAMAPPMMVRTPPNSEIKDAYKKRVWGGFVNPRGNENTLTIFPRKMRRVPQKIRKCMAPG
jgi:hypothetical protein